MVQRWNLEVDAPDKAFLLLHHQFMVKWPKNKSIRKVIEQAHSPALHILVPCITGHDFSSIWTTCFHTLMLCVGHG